MPISDSTRPEMMFVPALKRVMSHSRLYPFIEHHSLNVVQMLPGGDDFLGDTLRTDIYTVANGGGASAASPVITANSLNGVCDLVTGTAGDSTASSEISSGLAFRGDRSCVLVALLALSAITSVKVEVGFTDVATDAGAVNVKATPSFNADDCALWVLDTNNNANWEGMAANNGTTSPMATVAAAISPTAATNEWLMVELLRNDSADNQCAVIFRRFTEAGLMTFGPEVGSAAVGGAANPQGPNSDVLLTPWVYVEARNATSKTLSLDYWNAWQFRSVPS